MPRVSVIIPCYNSQSNIFSCLTAIKKSLFKEYELIVVDDHSSDDTYAIAFPFADKIIKLDKNKSSGYARKIGFEQASGDIIIFIDSDIMIKPDTLNTVVNFLDQNHDVDALTGLLSKDHPHKNFYSQYKNLYMNYIFNLLPQQVTFLFGSICAIRKKISPPNIDHLPYAPDTYFGQKLFLAGRKIAFLNNLEVVHLKKYTAWSLIKNDFRVPFSWAKIFLHFKGWRQLGKNNTGFAHAPKEQLLSVMIVFPLLLLLSYSLFFPKLRLLSYLLSMIWFCLNIRFFKFLFKERGLFFFLTSVCMTFFDHLIMAIGIICGFLAALINFIVSIRHPIC